MATRNWLGTTSTDWFNAGNWDTGVPGSADDVVIGTAANSPVVNANTTANSILIGGSDALSVSGTTGPDIVLTVTNGITLNSTGTLIGRGTIAAAVTATGAALISANGLTVNGPITDSGGALTLAVSGSLHLLAASAAQTVTLNDKTVKFGSNLELGPSSTLTVSTAMALGASYLHLDGPGSTFTDASGVTFSQGGFTTGHIMGQGTVNAGLSGTGIVIASGGTLHLTGTVASGLSLRIDSVTGSVLSIEDTATAAAPITITTGQTLAIGSSGNLTISGGSESVTLGKIAIAAGGQLSDSAGFVIGSLATLTGAGTVTGALTGTGTVAASGGTLELVSPLPVSSPIAFTIGSGANLRLDGATGAGNAFTFTGADGGLVLADDRGFNNTIAGLNVGAGGAKTNSVDIGSHPVGITSETGHGTTSGTITLTDGAVLNLTKLSSPTWFANVVGDGVGGTDVFVSDTPCFCRGTLILTARGEVPVEALVVGDRLATLSGSLKPIVWIGMGRSLVTRANKLARPIIVRHGALADNVPCRDLYLTHGHALYFDGVLIPVENLVNHCSVLWDETARVVEYYHIELADHDVLFADGAPAESYYDAGNRALFHNTRPGSQAGMAKPTFAPVLNSGEIVERVWTALFDRAGLRVKSDTTEDPDLHLVVDGVRLDPTKVEGDALVFALKHPPATTLLLCSRSGVPSLLGFGRSDHWALGVAIRKIILDHAGIPTRFDHHAPQFREGGCHPPEDRCCWTDGEFALPARFFNQLNGGFTLTVHTERCGMRYPVTRREAQAAA